VNTQAGRDLVALVASGVVAGSSFLFSPADTAWLEEEGEYVRELLRVELYEVSPCAQPAYPGTTCRLTRTYQMQTPVAGLDVLRGHARGPLELMRMRLRLAEAGAG
jgi:phage head maturation protease